MTRRRKSGQREKTKAGTGVLVGMRSGVKSMAHKVAHDAHDDEPEPTRSRVRQIVLNVLSALALVAAAGLMLHRCGIVK